MTQASLSVRLPAGTWIHDVTTTHPDATVRVLAGMPGDGVGVALVEVTAPDLEAVLRAMVDHDGLTDVEPLQRADDRVVLQIETTAPLLLVTARASGVPIEPPVTIADGVAALEIRTAHDRLSALGDQLDRYGLEYTVDAVRDGPEAESLLSERQATLLETAVECGYYDTPRRCTLTDLADEVGIAKSTCSETLHRAESTVVRRFVDTHLAADTGDAGGTGDAAGDGSVDDPGPAPSGPDAGRSR